MIKEKLLDKDYYLSKLSMFMKESYGIEGNVDLMLEWMRSINSASEYLTNVLDIWNEDYKNEMIKKFGFMYDTRVKSETPAKIRGQFLYNSSESVDISNISVKFANTDIDYEVETKDKYEFYAIQKSKSKVFVSGVIYYELDIKNNTKKIASPKGLELYEREEGTTVSYKPSLDEFFVENKKYYRENKIDANTYNYIEVSPVYLDLYEGNLYYFIYKDNDSYTLKNPNTMNLKKATFVNDDRDFDNNSYILKGSYFTKATPQNSNTDGKPLYDEKSGARSETKDKTFDSSNTYYKTMEDAEATTPEKCNLCIISDTDDDIFKSYDFSEIIDKDTWFRYCIANHNNYQIALPYNELLNFYHYSIVYSRSNKTEFEDHGVYYNKLARVTDEEVEGAKTQKVGIPVYLDTAHTTPAPEGDFDPTENYYTYNGDTLNPTNLKLLVKNGDKYEYSKDLEFESYVSYYILKQCSPKSLNLFINDGSGLVPCQDDYFENRPYFNEEGNSVTPYSLELTEKNINGYTLCEYSGNDNFYYRNYYTNETFKFQLFDDETHTFGELIEMTKNNPYFEYVDPYETLQGDGQPFKMLDVIASMVGCARENKIYYTEETEEGTSLIDETVVLSNEDLLDLIKIKIIQNNYKGTLKELLDLYKEKLHYQIYITLINQNNDFDNPNYESAACNVYLLEDKEYYDDNDIYIREPISNNIKKLFRYSDLFIQSLGIRYNKMYISDLDNILVLNKDYLYKNEKAIYSISEKEEAESRATSTKLG